MLYMYINKYKVSKCYSRILYIIIEGERIFLRDLQDEEVKDFVTGLNNINVAKQSANVIFPYTEKETRNYINSTQKALVKM